MRIASIRNRGKKRGSGDSLTLSWWGEHTETWVTIKYSSRRRPLLDYPPDLGHWQCIRITCPQSQPKPSNWMEEEGRHSLITLESEWLSFSLSIRMKVGIQREASCSSQQDLNNSMNESMDGSSQVNAFPFPSPPFSSLWCPHHVNHIFILFFLFLSLLLPISPTWRHPVLFVLVRCHPFLLQD